MSEAYAQPTYHPASERGIRKQEQSINQLQREHRDLEIDIEREYKRRVQARLDERIMVKIELVDPAREKMTAPLVMSIGASYFGFWRVPRANRGLLPWQEWMPASSALPRADGHPSLWKIIYDPRGIVPIPNIEDVRAEIEAQRNEGESEVTPEKATDPEPQPQRAAPKQTPRKATKRKR